MDKVAIKSNRVEQAKAIPAKRKKANKIKIAAGTKRQSIMMCSSNIETGRGSLAMIKKAMLVNKIRKNVASDTKGRLRK